MELCDHGSVFGRYAARVRRRLKAHPDWKGLRVPGMPPGSLGMDALDPDQYQALTISENGRTAWLTQH